MDGIVDELVGQYKTEMGTVNPWFTRRLKDQPPKVQAKVRDELRRRGLLDEEWITEEDWDWLCEEIVRDLPRYVSQRPQSSWVQLANELMAHRRPDLHKKITSRSIQPLIERMEKMWHERKQGRARLKEIEGRPSKEEMLASLSDCEVLEHFGERVLRLMLVAARRCHQEIPTDRALNP